MTNVIFDAYQFKTKNIGPVQQIFDEVRKKFVAFTPEEWVRQHCIQYLIQDRGYPKGLLAVEKEILLNGLKKRCDIVAFNTNGEPILIVECKSETEQINESVLQQILRYNQVLNVPYLWISNGKLNYCFTTHNSKIQDTVPFYSKIDLTKNG